MDEIETSGGVHAALLKEVRRDNPQIASE